VALKTSPKPQQDYFQSTAEAYAGLFGKRKCGASFSFHRRLDTVRQLCEGNSGALLDCAVGSGEVTEAVLQAGHFASATLIDFSPAMLALAKRRLASLPLQACHWVEGDCFMHLAKMDECYDTVLCLGLLAHTGRLDEIMMLLRRKVNTNGQVILQSTLSNHPGVALHRSLTAERYFRKHGYRISYQSEAMVIEAASRSGFRVREVHRYCLYLPFADRICPRINFLMENLMIAVSRRWGSEGIFVLEPSSCGNGEL
jgi:ubiquinone/menaquinone biosynthesis C-methylase UbiE